MPNNILKNPPFCLFASFLIVSLTPYINNPGNSEFSNGPRSLPKNSPDFPILCNWVFDNFILAEELLAKALKSLETCVLVNNKLCGKLFSL